MTKKITIRVAGTTFDMELDAEFAKTLEPEIEQFFNMGSNNSVKHLLEAYIKKAYEVHTLKQALKQNITKLQ